MMGAFETGWMAAELGKSLKNCPHHKATGEAMAWRNGWKAFWGQFGSYMGAIKAAKEDL